MNQNEKRLLAAAKLALRMIEEHGLDTMDDGKETEAASDLRHAILLAESKESRIKLGAMNRKMKKALDAGLYQGGR